MTDATIIYPHQLFVDHPAIATNRVIYLVEEPLLLTEFPTHRQKLLLHRLSLQAYKTELETRGHRVVYLDVRDHPQTEAVFNRLAADKITQLHVVDTTDFWLEKRLAKAASRHGFNLTRYESPLFILTKEEAQNRYHTSKKYLAAFYKKMRQDKNILLKPDGEPVGGKWSFDEDNRKKLPKKIELPAEFSHINTAETDAAKDWLAAIDSEQYGEPNVWVPYKRADAKVYLQDFLTDRLANFGTYEDAMTTRGTRLFHSTLSPLINIGLLTPMEVVNAALDEYEHSNITLNNIEGFVRQIIGWREFVRASYETDGTSMRNSNFWKHTRTLPAGYWDGTTGIDPVDHAITAALNYGYNHHIERLMVMGNFMLLSELHPNEVYKWFMAMYVDAYDWVMVPNVYGMSQFADGGSFATKPYISGSNYVRKMSDFEPGDWEETWTSLYWHFIGTHSGFFSANFRLAMMPRLLEKMDADKKERLHEASQTYFKHLDAQ